MLSCTALVPQLRFSMGVGLHEFCSGISERWLGGFFANETKLGSCVDGIAVEIPTGRVTALLREP